MMKIVINGGTGLIGAKTVERLCRAGHDVIAASPRGGVNSVTGAGLADAVRGADVLMDLSNSPSFDNAAVLDFFHSSTVNLLAAAKTSGVKHYIALSVVGTERLQGSGYFRAKLAQEVLIKLSGLPFTLVRATQFFEFLGAIANSGQAGGSVAVPDSLIQPIASDDVADIMAEVAVSSARNGTLEIAGPERFRLGWLLEKYLSATGDARTVEASSSVPYFGASLQEHTLVTDEHPHLGKTSFDRWFTSRGTAS